MLRAMVVLWAVGCPLLLGAEVRGVVRDAVSGEALARVEVAVQGAAGRRGRMGRGRLRWRRRRARR